MAKAASAAEFWMDRLTTWTKSKLASSGVACGHHVRCEARHARYDFGPCKFWYLHRQGDSTAQHSTAMGLGFGVALRGMTRARPSAVPGAGASASERRLRLVVMIVNYDAGQPNEEAAAVAVAPEYSFVLGVAERAGGRGQRAEDSSISQGLAPADIPAGRHHHTFPRVQRCPQSS